VDPVRQTAILILLGVVALTLALVVLVLNRDIESDLLAVLGVVGGLAIVVNSLPTKKD